MSTGIKTVRQLNCELKKSYPTGWKGKPLESRQLDDMQKILDDLGLVIKIQRQLSEHNLIGMGQLDLGLCLDVILSDRSNVESIISGTPYTVIDGHHHLQLYVNSGIDPKQFPLNVKVLTHDNDATVQEVEEAEARLYYSLNKYRKALTKLDELRSQLVFGDPFAIHVENVMLELNLVSDRFGSLEKDAKEVKNFSHFIQTLQCDYSCDYAGIKEIKEGYVFYNDIYGKDKSVQSNAFRCILFIKKFIDTALTNGKQESFKTFVQTKLREHYSQAKLVKNHGNYGSPRWVLYRVIDKYNDIMTNLHGSGAPTLGKQTLQIAEKVNPAFAHPDAEQWARITK